MTRACHKILSHTFSGLYAFLRWRPRLALQSGAQPVAGGQTNPAAGLFSEGSLFPLRSQHFPDFPVTPVCQNRGLRYIGQLLICGVRIPDQAYENSVLVASAAIIGSQTVTTLSGRGNPAMTLVGNNRARTTKDGRAAASSRCSPLIHSNQARYLSAFAEEE